MFRNRLLLLLAFISLFIHISCSVFYVPVNSEATVIKIDSTTALKEDSTVKAMINPYKLSLDSAMNEIIGYSERYLGKGNPEGLLNNLTADIILSEAQKKVKENNIDIKADFSLLNNGGLRISIPSGAITMRNIFELMPFDNGIEILELSGEKTKELFDYVASNKGEPISGAKMGIKGTSASDILIDDKPFDVSKNYYVVTSDYLANGGDNMSFFSNPLKRVNINYLVRDAIINYIKDQNKKAKVIDSKLDKRIYFE